MDALIQQSLTWLQLKDLTNKIKLTDQEDKDLANAAVAMARKQYKDSLAAHWEIEIEHRMKEERMLKEISEMLDEVNNEKRTLD
jgi:phosphopentomutase